MYGVFLVFLRIQDVQKHRENKRFKNRPYSVHFELTGLTVRVLEENPRTGAKV